MSLKVRIASNIISGKTSVIAGNLGNQYYTKKEVDELLQKLTGVQDVNEIPSINDKNNKYIFRLNKKDLYNATMPLDYDIVYCKTPSSNLLIDADIKTALDPQSLYTSSVNNSSKIYGVYYNIERPYQPIKIGTQAQPGHFVIQFKKSLVGKTILLKFRQFFTMTKTPNEYITYLCGCTVRNSKNEIIGQVEFSTIQEVGTAFISVVVPEDCTISLDSTYPFNNDSFVIALDSNNQVSIINNNDITNEENADKSATSNTNAIFLEAVYYSWLTPQHNYYKKLATTDLLEDSINASEEKTNKLIQNNTNQIDAVKASMGDAQIFTVEKLPPFSEAKTDIYYKLQDNLYQFYQKGYGTRKTYTFEKSSGVSPITKDNYLTFAQQIKHDWYKDLTWFEGGDTDKTVYKASYVYRNDGQGIKLGSNSNHAIITTYLKEPQSVSNITFKIRLFKPNKYGHLVFNAKDENQKMIEYKQLIQPTENIVYLTFDISSLNNVQYFYIDTEPILIEVKEDGSNVYSDRRLYIDAITIDYGKATYSWKNFKNIYEITDEIVLTKELKEELKNYSAIAYNNTLYSIYTIDDNCVYAYTFDSDTTTKYSFEWSVDSVFQNRDIIEYHLVTDSELEHTLKNYPTNTEVNNMLTVYATNDSVDKKINNAIISVINNNY